MNSHARHWTPMQVSRGQQRAAQRDLDDHLGRSPKCERRGADVCVHPWLFGLFVARFCTACGRSI